jgi:hypothetical protein
VIRCAICQGRVRPPDRPWTTTESGDVHFYRSGTDMRVYAKELSRVAKRIRFVHEFCVGENPGLMPVCIVALDLQARLHQKET